MARSPNPRTKEYLIQEQEWIKEFKNDPRGTSGYQAALKILDSHQTEINTGLKKRISSYSEREALKPDCEAYILDKIYTSYKPDPPLFLYINGAILFFCFQYIARKQRMTNREQLVDSFTLEFLGYSYEGCHSLWQYFDLNEFEEAERDARNLKEFKLLKRVVDETQCVNIQTDNYTLLTLLAEGLSPYEVSLRLDWEYDYTLKRLTCLRSVIRRRQNRDPISFKEVIDSLASQQ